jgi:TOD1/MUCI70, glycosyltransferase-like domain
MSFAIVTGVFGAYEPLLGLPPGVSGQCFSDGTVGAAVGWSLRPLPLQLARRIRLPRLKNRYVKTHVHKLTGADVVLYVDGSFRIVTDPTDWALEALGDAEMAAYRHPLRNCVYAEAEACIRQRQGNAKAIAQQLARYRAAGLPRSSGLYGGGLLVMRNTGRVRDFCARWWEEICAGSERDQLSLGFLMWKQPPVFRAIPGNLYRPPFAQYRGHKRR